MQYPFTDSPYQWKGIPVYPCNGQNRWWRRWRAQQKALRYVQQLAKALPNPILHSFWLGQAWWVGQKAATTLGLSHTTTLMGQDILPEKNRYWLSQITRSTANSLVALTQFQAEHWLSLHGTKVSALIPLGVAASSLPSTTTRQHRIVGVGSFLPVKNWSLWLQVVQRVAILRPDYTFSLIGSGPLEASLKQEAEALGLKKRITWISQLEHPALMNYISESSVLLHTSHFEGFGMVLAEAAAMGCYVVSTPVGIASELGRTATDLDGLTEHILAVTTPPNLRPESVIFTAEQSAKRYLEYWQARTFAP
jgi:glycosyltransferase involved in cell wall biosynthesis